jgi:uncharacterized protein (TIGR03435 family)
MRRAVLAIALFAAPLLSQTTPAPTFEVASIRLTSATDGHIHIWSSPGDGNFRAQNVSVTDLLEFAYNLPESRFIGGANSGLMREPRFDLEAKSDAVVDAEMKALASEVAKEKKRRMAQALLADRFQLKTHTETRELPIYTLVVAKGGPKFTESKASGTSYNYSRGSLSMEGGDSTVEMMAANLAQVLGRPVVNQTNIKGRYLMKLRWLPDDGPPPLVNGAPDTSLPSIFTAIEEQLGLKLVSGKGPVQVLVVDQLKMPSAN